MKDETFINLLGLAGIILVVKNYNWVTTEDLIILIIGVLFSFFPAVSFFIEYLDKKFPEKNKRNKKLKSS